MKFFLKIHFESTNVGNFRSTTRDDQLFIEQPRQLLMAINSNADYLTTGKQNFKS